MEGSTLPTTASTRERVALQLPQQGSLSDGEVGSDEPSSRLYWQHRRHSGCPCLYTRGLRGHEHHSNPREQLQDEQLSAEPDLLVARSHCRHHDHQHSAHPYPQHHHQKQCHHHVQPLSSTEGAPHIDMDEFQGHRRPKSKSIPYDTACLRRRHSTEGLRRASIPENDIITSFPRLHLEPQAGGVPPSPPSSSSSPDTSPAPRRRHHNRMKPAVNMASSNQRDPVDLKEISDTLPPLSTISYRRSPMHTGTSGYSPGSRGSSGGSTRASSTEEDEEEEEEDEHQVDEDEVSQTKQVAPSDSSGNTGSIGGAEPSPAPQKPRRKILKRKNTPANFPRIPKLDFSVIKGAALEEDMEEEP